MDKELFRDLVVNASLLLAISIIYNVFAVKRKKRKVLFSIMFGSMIGICGILLMVNTVDVSPGIIFDTRSILVSVCGMFFGLIPTAAAVVVISAGRIAIGGSGAFTGVLVTVATAGIGLLWNRFRIESLRSRDKAAGLEFYLFSVITHVVMLLCLLTLPGERVWLIIRQISLPVMLIYPIGSWLLCMVLYSSLRNYRTAQNLEISELNFRTMVEQAPIGIAISVDGTITYTNPMLEQIIGRSKEELSAHSWESYTHPDDLANDLEHLKALNAGKINGYILIKRYIHPDKSVVWVNMVIASLIFPNNSKHSHLCMIQDITGLVKTAADLRESEARYKALYHELENKQNLLVSLLNSIPDLIFYKDLDGKYMGCNHAFANYAGKDAAAIIGCTDFELFNQETAALFRSMDVAMMSQKNQRMNEESVVYPDGSKVFLETLKTPYYDPEGDVLGLIGISRDITDRKRKETEIQYLNFHDTLTGLYNRTFFDEECRRLDAPHQLPLSLVIGDINGLKLINDAFGHAAGDMLLVEIAKILKSCCREEEIIARTGGDEFSIILPKTDSTEAKLILDRIKEACEKYVTQSEQGVYHTSISLGTATKTVEDESLEKVYEIAEEHMNRHKLLEYRSLHSLTISSIKTTLFEKSNETEEHAERMAKLSKKLGIALGLAEEDLVSLELAATLHDIGKISIDRNILDKQGQLGESDWAEIRRHPEVGFRIAQTVPELRRIAEDILSHHERWDGKGYPRGLAGEEIPLLSRILSIVDAYDAMTEDRPYRKAMSREAAIDDVIRNEGTQFDPFIASVFIDKVLGEIDPAE